MKYLSVEDILEISFILVDEAGGAHGLRDKEALLSLVKAPRQTFGGKDLYSDIFLKAAVYLKEIITRHPFVDGNKRTAMTAAFVFLAQNGYVPTAKKGEVKKFAFKVIKNKLEILEISGWLKKNSKKIGK